MEGENPTRRYKSFRPRQAMRGYTLGDPNGNPTNFGTVALFNDSKGAQALIVRAVDLAPPSNLTFIASGPFQGLLGAIGGGFVKPMVPDGGTLPGVFTFVDETVARDGDYISNFQTATALPWKWPYPFPFSVLPPQWSLFFQIQGHAYPNVALVWEAIFPDELDYAFEL